jgi:hypothetical protein
MKTLMISFCLLALCVGSPRTMSVEIRGGAWPINLERTKDRPGVSFSLIFRDESEMQATVLDTLDFADAEQLRYFGKGLTVLQHGNNGDIARFKDYTLTRADKKVGGVFYILRPQYGTTSFQQPEADVIKKTIQQW